MGHCSYFYAVIMNFINEIDFINESNESGQSSKLLTHDLYNSIRKVYVHNKISIALMPIIRIVDIHT